MKKRKMLRFSCLLAVLLLLLGAVPSYAADLDTSEGSGPETVMEEEKPEGEISETEAASDEEGPGEAAGEGADAAEAPAEETAPPAVKAPLRAGDNWGASFEPVRNTTTTTLTLSGFEALKSSGEADSVVIDATMSYGGKTTRSVSQTIQFSAFGSDGTAVVDLGEYGKWSVKVTFKKSSTTVHTNNAVTTGILADAYNISPVSATLPVTFFSLNLWGDGNIRENGPTILLMERPNAYDWNKLPEGVYALPYMTKEDISYQPGDATAASRLFREREPIMADYVKDLLAIHQSVAGDVPFIHLWCVDYYADLVQKVIYANKVPAEKYDIILMSDGAFTYSKFGEVYNGTDPSSQHTALVNAWNDAKSYAYANGTVKSGFGTAQCGKYLWALVDSEPNAQLWITRKDLMATPNDGGAFGKTVQADPKVVAVSIANLLKTNIQTSETNKTEFKALYKFNDSYFVEAEEQGKDAMVFLGTRVTLEKHFEAYARFVMTYYGDDYVYYYKGHPATPTDLYPEKVDQLERLGVKDVDASVAAELILFFNPEIYLSGYNSSTYASVPKGMGKGMFEMTKAYGTSPDHPDYNNMDFWSTMVEDSAAQKIKDLCIAGNESYLVEFSDEVIAAEGYDIAIWDADKPEIRYYKDDNGTYRLVGSDSGVIGAPVVAPGTYVIGSPLRNDAVLDVASGSQSSGANVQLYTYNKTDAQKWTISYDSSNHATIINVKSGLALDVKSGKTANGTNVQQYKPNGSKAQKWIFTKNADGSVKITSLLSPTVVLDVSGAKSADKTNVQIYKDNGSKAQTWRFFPVTPDVPKAGQAELADGYYTIASAVKTDLALQVAGWSTKNGANIEVGTLAGTENQLFRITKKNGYYLIESAWNGGKLNVDGGSLIPTTNVQTWKTTSTNSQWAIYLRTGGSYVIENVASGQMLDLSKAKKEAGTNVDVYFANGTQAQRWIITPAEDPVAKLDALAKTNEGTLANGNYVISAGKTGSMVLTVSGASKADKANVELAAKNNTAVQTWTVTHDADGYVTFKNKATGKVLDIAGASKKNGANVQQYTGNDTRAQKWIVIKQKDGTYKVVSALSSRIVLDIKSGTIAAGQNVQTYKDNGTNAQRFRFTKK